MIVHPIYRCLLCNTSFTAGNPVDVAYEQIPDLLGKVIQNQMFMSNPALYQFPMHLPHKCQDHKGGGLAMFIGFKEV